MKLISSILSRMLSNKQEFIGSMKGSNFETLFELELLNNGMKKLPKNKLSTGNLKMLKTMVLNDNITNTPHNIRYNNPISGILHDGWFIEQPFGTQSFPDFIVAENGKILAIEMKKVKSAGCPMWNGGLPRVNGLYIFMRLHKPDITFFMGNTVISDERFSAMKHFYKMVEELKQEYNKTLNNLGYDERQFILAPRAAFAQSGSEANYFTHTKRTITESETIKQVGNLGGCISVI